MHNQSLTERVIELEHRIQCLEALAELTTSETGHGHCDSGERCLVAHYDYTKKLSPPCIRCALCHQYIRPERMGDQCPGVKQKQSETTSQQ